MKATGPRPLLLTSTLCRPERARGFDKTDWECLIWQSRAAELMAQLRQALSAADVLRFAPPPARRHLDLASAVADRHASAVRSELRFLQEALQPLNTTVLLLKGAAYSALSQRVAAGRIFNDIDVMVPRAALSDVEQRLNWSGWFPLHTSRYDEHYYREWMHEIPPLEHKNRGTVLDVHHTILPPTSGIRPDPQDLFDASMALPGEWEFFRVLAPTDMVIHSACHLFFGEFHKGLRDLLDLHVLLTDFSVDPTFWDALIQRAGYLRLAMPVLDAIEQCQRIYETRVPATAVGVLRRTAVSPWPRWTRAWLFDHALRPAHASAFSRSTRLAHWLTFARSHWLRMPMPLLAYHLSQRRSCLAEAAVGCRPAQVDDADPVRTFANALISAIPITTQETVVAQPLSDAEQALREAALEYHRAPTRGKISVTPTKPLTQPARPVAGLFARAWPTPAWRSSKTRRWRTNTPRAATWSASSPTAPRCWAWATSARWPASR